MSMNNAIIIKEIPVEQLKTKGFYYEVFEIPCVDNDLMVFLKRFTSLRSAIVYVLKQEFEYGVLFEGFNPVTG